jgi:hypothetical protein
MNVNSSMTVCWPIVKPNISPLREGLKNDQCFVEQKNGAIVRQVVGYTRFEGERAYRQLGEVYQALPCERRSKAIACS